MNFLSNDNFDSESLLTDDGYKIIEEEEKFSNLV